MFKKFKTMSKEKEINIEDGNVQETVQNENNEQTTQNENTEENQNTDNKAEEGDNNTDAADKKAEEIGRQCPSPTRPQRVSAWVPGLLTDQACDSPSFGFFQILPLSSPSPSLSQGPAGI